jgi:hypothetical protein
MKTLPVKIFALTFLAFSCLPKHENKLERKFEKQVVRKEFITKIETHSPDTASKDTVIYYIGYDDKNRVVNEANSEFYEYDSLGRVSKRYSCILDRDPTCSKPYISIYEYSDGKLSTIKLLNSFRDSVPYIYETFEYDLRNRLIRHTKNPTDTFVYSYLGNGTLKRTELWTHWVTTLDSTHKWVPVPRTTTFKYDSSGRKISSTWTDGDMSMRSDFSYDNNNRIIMQRDTSLDNFIAREPNSCCILYWTEYKYGKNNKLVEEIHSVGMNDKPEPHLNWKVTYEY